MVSRGLIGLARKQFTYQSKPLVDTSSYREGCIKIAPSLLHYYCPMARDTHPMFGLSLGFLPMLTTTQAPWNFWHRSYHVLTNLDRCMDVAGLFKTLELNRPLSSNSFFFFRQKQPLLFSLFLLSSSSLFFFFFFPFPFHFLCDFAAYRKKPVFWFFFTQMAANFAWFVFKKSARYIFIYTVQISKVFSEAP